MLDPQGRKLVLWFAQEMARQPQAADASQARQGPTAKPAAGAGEASGRKRRAGSRKT